MTAEATLAICKAEWADARLRHGDIANPAMQKLAHFTDAFLASDHALDAFRAGWSIEQLFGMRRDGGQACGLICLAALGAIEIDRFDEAGVWLRPAGEIDTPISYQPKDFPVDGAVPWWQQDVPLAH